jgi:O-antigen ligase
VNAAFNVALVGAWLTDSAGVYGGVLDLNPGMYAGIVPRLAGQTLDPNRGAMVSIVLLFLVFRFGKPSPARAVTAFVTIFSLIGALSRSAILGSLGVLGAAFAERRRLRITRGRLAAGCTAMAAATLVLLVVPGAVEMLGVVTWPLTERFSTRDGGNSLHFEMIERGLDVAGRSWKNALIGIGYGNAGPVLADLLPDTKYGNFHSQYATLLAETGFVALLVGMIIMLYPAVRRNPFRPVAAGFLLFNVFYQLLTEPAFWLVMACAWLGVGAPARAPDPAPRAPPAPPLPAGANAAAG